MGDEMLYRKHCALTEDIFVQSGLSSLKKKEKPILYETFPV
jgi:hypothetical protein